jgi:serine/threonine-protein phosphatase Stp1
VKAFTNELDLEVGDVVVLCSDGVEEAGVTPHELLELMENDDLQAAVEELIKICRERGGPDNITVAAVRVE